jgi:hypothetical protein
MTRIHSSLPGFAATQLGLADAGRCAVKTLTREGDGSITSSDYDNGFEWWFRLFDAGSDFDQMARELRRMARQERVILCMGSPKPGLDLSVAHRRLWARSDPHENTMVAASRAWIAIDVGDAAVPAGVGDPERFVEGAIYVRDQVLPEEFRSCTVIVSPSARTGLRGPTLLRSWTKGLRAVIGVGDPAIVQIGQPIYVGRARFIGMRDPISPQLWAVVVCGSKDRVALVAGRYEPTVAKIDHEINLATAASGDDWRGFLKRTVGGDLFFFEPLSKGLWIAVRSNDPDAAIVSFTLALLKKRADPGRIAQYDSVWIGRTLKRFRAMDSSGETRREAALSRLFGD